MSMPEKEVQCIAMWRPNNGQTSKHYRELNPRNVMKWVMFLQVSQQNVFSEGGELLGY